MFSKINRQLTLLSFGVLFASFVGCSGSDYPEGFKSKFVYGERTESLIAEAQNGVGDLPGVKDMVDQRFGNPQDLNGWSKLPIDFGGVTGKVSETPEEGIAVKELVIDFESSVEQTDDQPILIQFVTGDAAPSVAVIQKWSDEVNRAALTTSMEVSPKAGDIVVVSAGENLVHGRGLYMRHCSHCHGTSGDGQGPTARYLNPRPRDYRHGVFKFTSTLAQSKVSREDLTRVLRNGVAGTYMPSFVPMLDDDELYDVVEYVRFLSMRGEFERKLAGELSADYSKEAVAARKESGESYNDIVGELKDFFNEDLADSLEFVTDDLSSSWENADEESSLIQPDVPRIPDSIQSRRLGRELFLSKAINCADCHGVSGKGNGPQTTIFEKNPTTQELYPEPGLHDVWDNVNQPRNLTHGIYRGGRRPIDLFCRIHAGIKGSRMPSYKSLKHEEIWHIVNYVLSVPFESEPGHAPAAVEPATTASK